ncbi:domain conserved site protein [Rutstroemia sp. NJR-2017a BVV2]|nr:domain conserved site protein [Rutstroemia sp. NJR-2017a BVV2]
MAQEYWLSVEEIPASWYPKDWCSQDHIPHYFNLNVPINATTLDIKQAYRRLIRTIHPDKIRDHKHKAAATQALILVTNAFDTLSDPVKRDAYTVSCRVPSWSEYCPKVVKQPVLAWENRRLMSERKTQLVIDQQKPWWWEYTPMQSIGLGKHTPSIDGFCPATWVNFAHLVIDNSLPTTISDGIWQHAQQWRTKATSSERQIDNITFYKGCEEIVLQLDTAKVIPRWSSIQSDTNWATLGSFGDLFCPDILLVPMFIFTPITIYWWYLLYKYIHSLFAPHAADNGCRNTTDSPTTTVILNLPARTTRGFTPYPTPRTLAERPVIDSDSEDAGLGISTGCAGTTVSKRPCHRKVSVASGTLEGRSVPLCFQHRKRTA